MKFYDNWVNSHMDKLKFFKYYCNSNLKNLKDNVSSGKIFKFNRLI